MKKSPKTRVLEEISQFFQESTVHGLNYLGDRSSHYVVKTFWLANGRKISSISVIIATIFQAIVVISGFLTTWFLYDLSERDRHDRPLITTIESMAVPVHKIPFPSVTVCQDFHSSPDSWAMVRAVANSYQYSCYQPQRDCSKLTALHAKLQPFVDVLFDSLGKEVERELDKIRGGQADTFRNMRTMRPFKDSFKQIRELILRNLSTAEDVWTDLKVNFPKHRYLTVFNEKIHDETECDEKNATCTDAAHFAETAAMTGYILYIGGPLPLGSLLASLAPNFGKSLERFETFDRTTYCKDLSEIEVLLYETFEEIGQQIGIDPSAGLSLFELPSFVHYGELADHFQTTLPFRHFHVYHACTSTYGNKSVVDYSRRMWEAKSRFKECSKLWQAFVNQAEESENPCTTNNTECCPDLMGMMNGNFTLLMALMKHLYHLGSVHAYTSDFVPYLNTTRRTFDSPLLSEEEQTFEANNHQNDRLAMIPICSFAGKERRQTHQGRNIVNKCKLFRPTWTDGGVCQSFNSIQPRQMLKDSEYKAAFEMVFGREDSSDAGTEEALVPGIGGGDDRGISFYVDRQTFLQGDAISRYDKHSSTFHVAINNAFNAFDVSSGLTKIRMGYETLLLIKPEQLSSDPSVRGLDLDKRKCRFMDEVKDGSLFEFYTQDLCIFQCMLRRSFEKCNCIPWGYPRWNGTSKDVCDRLGTYCFEETMKHLKNNHESCNCLPDCDSVQFTYSEKEWPLNPEKECSFSSNLLIYLIQKQINVWNRGVDALNYFTRNISVGDGPFYKNSESKYYRIELCKELLKEDIALVRVQLDSDKFLRFKQSIKLSFTDQIASFGGTLGLFTGMSFVSIIEIIFWIMRMTYNIIKKSAG